MKKIIFLLMSLLMVLPNIQAQQDLSLKRKVAIGRFSNETQYAKSVFYDKNNDPMGKQASDILATKLAETNKFMLIERQDFDKIADELKNGGGSSQKIGADYLIFGSITQFGRKTLGTQKLFSNQKEQIVEASVSMRLVDVSTGVVIFSGEAQGDANAVNKTIMGLGKEADYDATLADKAISAAITKLVENIVNKCMDNPWKAYLLTYEDGNYIISGGASQGIKSGLSFNVIKKGKSIKNPQTGMMIELPGKEVATIKIVQTLGNTPESEVSIASLSSGTIDNNDLASYYITDK